MGHLFSLPNHSAPNTALVIQPSRQDRASDCAHQTISTPSSGTDTPHTHSSPTHPAPSSSSVPLASQLSYPLLHPAPASPPLQPSHVTQPPVFYVPRNSREILDFSPNSGTPESKAKHTLLSNNQNENAIALVGMGGAGKTTILRALGRNADVWTKFPEGVWFIQLGHDATVHKLLDQLQDIVFEAFPDFCPKFSHLAARENSHHNLVNQFVDRLITKRFLLIFDDVWDFDSNVYTPVDYACRAVQGIEGACCKVLTSTRNERVGRVPMHDVSIQLSPEHSRRETCVKILCSYAGIDPDTLPSFSSPNRDALEKIVDLCAGLPLALSVAGSAMQDLFGIRTDVCGPDAIVQYWESLKKSTTQLAVAEVGSRHVGLKAALKLSLELLEKGWEGRSMTVGKMFRSFCILQKQMYLPLDAIEKLWGVNDALVGVRMLSRHSLISLHEEDGGSIVGVRLHDLVHELCVEMAEKCEGVGAWHAQFVDAYRASIRTCEVANDQEGGEMEERNSTEEDRWWKLGSKDKYMIDNIVRHLLDAGRFTEAVQLLTDYRWIQGMNEKTKERPFQKIISELQLLRRYLENEEKTETGRRIASGIAIVERAMEQSTPCCIKNRRESTFQLYGRLRDISSENHVVERIILSTERHGRRPWALAGPQLLKGGRSSLKHVLNLECGGKCMCVGAREEVIVLDNQGKIRIVRNGDGTLKKSLVGHEEDERVVDVFFDHSSGLIYSCGHKGRVIIWKEHEKWRSMEFELQDNEETRCMQVLSSLKKVVLGTVIKKPTKGRLLVMDMGKSQIETIDAHGRGVTSLAVSRCQGIMVSGSRDGSVRVWDTKNLEEKGKVIEGLASWVKCMALTHNGSVLASGSEDGTIQVWDTESGELRWTLADEEYGRVGSVVFSNDGRLLYSAHHRAIRVWRVNDSGRDVSLLNTIPEYTWDVAGCSLCIGHDSQLLELNGNRVQVWDEVQVRSSIEHRDAFLPQVDRIAVSDDAATMLTVNRSSSHLEIRNVDDVSRRIDRVISSCKISPFRVFANSMAVSNDRRFIAYNRDGANCVVHLINAHNGSALHSLSDLDQWALSSSHASSSNASSGATQVDTDRAIESMRFSPDGTALSAVAAVRVGGENGALEKNSMSWNVSSGELLDNVQLDGDSTASNTTAIPQLSVDKQWTTNCIEWNANVTYTGNEPSFIIASLEDYVRGAHYSSDASRLFVSTHMRGICHIDLVTDSTQLPMRHAPPLPLLSHSHPPQSDDHTTSKETKQVYDVFISHAGPDKRFIAEPLYHALVELGLKVFLDKMELHPGQNAPQKMNRAMETARIAVVILSPEFAARPWTTKELLCFLGRFKSAGEWDVIIIPAFYRLTLDDCRDAVLIEDEDGNKVLMKVEFLQRIAQKDSKYCVADVVNGLKAMRSFTGIENLEKATNGDGKEAAEKRKAFIGRLVDGVLNAMGRIKSGNLAGPSSAS